MLREALEEAELEDYLDAGLLLRLWSSLTLPRQVRAAWEQQHPDLTA